MSFSRDAKREFDKLFDYRHDNCDSKKISTAWGPQLS